MLLFGKSLAFWAFPLIMLATVPAAANAQDIISPVHQERENFARNFAQTVITILHDPKTPYMHRKDILRQSFVKSMDIDWIAKFVLGRPWKDASEEQKERYLKLYRRFLTETYVMNFAENPQKSIYSIKVTGVNDGDNNDIFTVHTHVELTNRTDLKVDYLIADENSHYKVRDIVIENVSLIATHRAQFSALAAAQGVDAVIHTLEDAVRNLTEVKVSME